MVRLFSDLRQREVSELRALRKLICRLGTQVIVVCDQLIQLSKLLKRKPNNQTNSELSFNEFQ